MTEIENIFKINDIKDTDPLKNKKISTINFLKRSFLRPLIKKTEKDSEIVYQPSHFYWIIEEYRRYLEELFKNYPDLHDPVKKPDVRKKWKKGWGDLNDNHYKILRSHYKLFFNEGLDGNNWREKIRDAESTEKITEIEQLISKVRRDFDRRVRSRIKGNREWIKKLSEENKNEKKSDALLGWVAAKVYTKGQGMGIVNFVAYELLKKEIEEVLIKTKEKYQRLGFDHGLEPDFKVSSDDKPESNEVSASDSSDNSEDDSDTDSENENVSPQDLEKQLREVKEKLKKSDKPSQNDKEEIEKKIDKIQENADNENLRKEIEELRKQLVEIKKTLKEILANAKDFAQKLFSYFQKEQIKQITFEENGSAKIEYEDNKQSKTYSVQEVDNHQELKELKAQVQQSEQKSLSRHELSQIIGSNSPSPTSNEKEEKHWEKYKYYYFAGIGIGLFVIGGLIVYGWMKKEQKEIE